VERTRVVLLVAPFNPEAAKCFVFSARARTDKKYEKEMSIKTNFHDTCDKPGE